MSDGNETKTKEQLLAEIEALKKALDQRSSDGGKSAAEEPNTGAPAPVFSSSMNRRQALTNWVAPVILSLPTAVGVGMLLKPETASAQSYGYDAGPPAPLPTFQPTFKPTFKPTFQPTFKPTAKPTALPTSPKPTFQPTFSPTFQPTFSPTFQPTFSPTFTPTFTPTAKPTATPTRAGRCIVMPTKSPTVSPTLGMASAPDCGPSPVGFIALGSARAVARGELTI